MALATSLSQLLVALIATIGDKTQAFLHQNELMSNTPHRTAKPKSPDIGLRQAKRLCQMPHEKRLAFIAEGLPIILQSARGFWSAAKALENQPREAAVLEGFALEEAAKILILMDMVRCPRKQLPARIGTMIDWFYDHLARIIYAEATNRIRATDVTIKLVEAMASLGLFALDALKILSDVWDRLVFETTQDHRDATRLVWKTLEQMQSAQLISKNASQDDTNLLAWHWQLPMYTFDFSRISVSFEELEAEQARLLCAEAGYP